MSEVTVGRWGRSLAVRVPAALARKIGLTDGEQVELESDGGDLVIRRSEARSTARTRGAAAADALRALSRGHRLGRVSIGSLIEEGRR